MNRGVLIVLLLMLAGLTGLPALAAVYEAREMAYLCAVEEAPRWERVTGGTVVVADGRQTLWPLGGECRLETAAGERIVLTSGWFATGLAISAGGAVVAALILVVLPLRRRPSAALR